MQVNATPILSMPKSGAFGPYLRVNLSSGTLALAGALDREIGTIKEKQLASGIGSASVAPVIHRRAAGTVNMIANGAISQYGRVYGAASGKVSATANGNFIGIAMTATTADGDELEVLRLDGGNGIITNSVASSSAVTTTSSETDFDVTSVIPANMLRAGDVIRVRGTVLATATNSTDTLTIKVYIGSTVLITSAAVDVANADSATFELLITIRTDGATGTFVAGGIIVLKTSATSGAVASTTIDTTAAQTIKASATWSTNNAGNSCILQQFLVERVGTAI